LRLLEELAEIGMDMARALRRQALAQADAAEIEASDTAHAVSGDVGLTFSRIARAVRLTLALEARTAEAASARRSAAAADRAARREEERFRALVTPRPADPREAVIERIVEQAIEAEIDDPKDVDHMMGDFYERLDEDEAYADPAGRPIGEIVARICRDLRLDPDWSRWANEPWAVEEARTASAGSPYAVSPVSSSPPPFYGGGGAARSAMTEGASAAAGPLSHPPDSG
jgi:hypothetical protein